MLGFDSHTEFAPKFCSVASADFSAQVGTKTSIGRLLLWQLWQLLLLLPQLALPVVELAFP